MRAAANETLRGGGKGLRLRITPQILVRLAVGGVLIAAAALKTHQLATEPVAGRDLFTNRWALLAVVEFEFVLGIGLVSGLWVRGVWYAATGCFAFFTVLTLSKALSGEASCGCFGRVEINPWYTLALDLSTIAALAIFRPASGPVPATPLRGWQVAGAALAMLTAGIASGVAIASFAPASVGADGVLVGRGSIVLLEPEKWAGHPLPIRDFITGVDVSEGDWVVLLVHHDCPDCNRTIADYRRPGVQSLAAEKGLRVAFVEVPPYGLAPEPAGSPIARGRLKDTKEWFVTTPVVVALAEGTVERGWEGEVPALGQLLDGRRK